MSKKDITDILRSNNTIFTFKDISLIWQETNLDLVKSRVNYYVKQDELYPLRRGIYAKDKNYDRFELATKIYTPAYISFETVLAKEGVIFQHYSQIFVASYLSREIVCDGQTYVFKKLKDFILNNQLGLERTASYFIASRERAFLDTLYLNKKYHFDNLSGINWDTCRSLLPIYGSQTLDGILDSYV